MGIRPDLFINFYLKEDMFIREGDGDYRRLVADTILVGPHSFNIHYAYLLADVHYFSIQLMPTALHVLLDLPTFEIADREVRAVDVFGNILLKLRDEVFRARTFDGRVVAAERWIANALDRARETNDIDEAARLIRRTAGTVPLRSLAVQAGLSDRQWRRRFEEQAGLPPKLYARVTRLDATLERRRAFPDVSWADIAYKGGYADQSRMLRDTKSLLGMTPAAWLAHPELGAHALSHLQSAGAASPFDGDVRFFLSSEPMLAPEGSLVVRGSATMSQASDPASGPPKNGEVVVVLTLRFKPGTADKVLAGVTPLVAPTREEQGNCQFDVFRVTARPDTLVIFERWKDRQALEDHWALPTTRLVLKLFEEHFDEPLADGRNVLYLTDTSD